MIILAIELVIQLWTLAIRETTLKVSRNSSRSHDVVTKWKYFPRYWTFTQGIHRSPVNSPQKGQWRGALMFSLICAWTNNWANNEDAGDLIRHRAHYDVVVMSPAIVNDVIFDQNGKLTRSCTWHVYKLRLRQFFFSVNTVNIHERWRDNIKVVTYSYGAHAILIVNVAVWCFEWTAVVEARQNEKKSREKLGRVKSYVVKGA